MAYGYPANVRSHRRGRYRRRRRRVAPWLTGTLVMTMIVVGLGFAYTQLLASTCSGEQTLRVVAPSPTSRLLSEIASEWRLTEPATSDGTCAVVLVESRDPAEVADLLTQGWDAGEPPDVWISTSSAWSQKVAASDTAEPLIPDLRPSIARSPTVIAMPQPMAAALNWPDTEVDDSEVRWESLVSVFGDDPSWARFGHEEWGTFRFGMGDPRKDTAALLALMAILDSDDNGETSTRELDFALRLQQLLDPDRYHETTPQLLNALAEADAQGEEEALAYVSAFPALEQQVLAYNRNNPNVPLAAIYPVNGNIEADYPYLVLNGDWVTDAKREVAAMFLDHLRSDGPQQRLREAGFRGTNREPGEDFNPELGLLPELSALPRALLVPESVTLSLDRWTALIQPMNVLILFDTSGSMLFDVPGTGGSRMDQAVAAATGTVRLFGDDDRVGLWEFSTDIDGENDHLERVSIGPLNEPVTFDGLSRREFLISEIENLVGRSDTGLYNSIQAAFDTMVANYDPEATNMIVVLTDGENDTAGRPTITLEELLDHVQAQQPSTGNPIKIIPVAFGEEADFTIMQQVAQTSGGTAYYSERGFDLPELFRTAVFGNVG
jgi:Ca-activated chloride channel family protein